MESTIDRIANVANLRKKNRSHVSTAKNIKSDNRKPLDSTDPISGNFYLGGINEII
ncbi:hypothetical protein GCM10007423_00310 [Dyadobacter endophyticus]|uniref:Uncharacterized protein n=1 Tax=Dyadobacter endophyticus TaxID=1749036 RepID=A0ABQ1YCH7_9BACT|nr:hypothetical protein GCM10007423_00310 [Dyadobacter endophyticus]